MDFSYVTTQDSLEGDGDLKSLLGPDRSNQSKRNLPPIWSEVILLLIFLTSIQIFECLPLVLDVTV